MFKVEFKYKDELSKGKWNSQECILAQPNKAEAVKECIRIYGLNEPDVDYVIISVKEV